MDTEVGLLGVGHTIEGTRRGPRIRRKSSGAQMNLRSADSCPVVEVEVGVL